LIPVVTDPKKAAGALNWAVGEMMRRYALFAETATRNLKGYNEQAEKNGTEKLPQIVIIIDELADLMMVAAKEVEDYICRLAQLARAAGIHLIIATQRPSVDVITGLIKANVPSRIAFAVSSGVDSRTILDKVGAEKLLGKGDMLYHPTGLPNAMRVQGAFVSDEEIESLIAFIKENSEETSYAQDLADHIERMATGDNGVTDENDGDDADELLPQAIELAAERGEISTSIIQTKMKVGYARARRIVDQMETRGLIGGANGSKPREVYLNRIRALYDDTNVYEDDYDEDVEEELEVDYDETEEYDEE
ncbi:MAG: DNA translocase FtsK, partial [Clostridia bacterium]|nr:DNA translocase FtsK [Clostridia bacterium]